MVTLSNKLKISFKTMAVLGGETSGGIGKASEKAVEMSEKTSEKILELIKDNPEITIGS
jgi:hypothetical protein